MKPALPPVVRMLLILALATAATGCERVLKVNVPVMTSFPADKIPAFVHLEYASNFSQSQWKFKSAGDTYLYNLGPVLKEDADHAVRAAFKGIAPAGAPAAGTLSVKVISISQAIQVWAWEPMEMIITLEWELKDAGGKTVWVATVQGKGKGDEGTFFSFEDETNKRAKLACDDLFNQSYKIFLASPEIRKWAQSSTP